MSEPENFDLSSETGLSAYWTLEIDAAKARLKDWREKTGPEVVKRYLDERRDSDQGVRWNLFRSNIETQRALLYGQSPKTDVSRRHLDQSDDVARVAALMLQRVLNSDVEEGDGYESGLGYALYDSLLVDFGLVRWVYEPTIEDREITQQTGDSAGNAVTEKLTVSEKVDERTRLVYVPWKHALWSEARVWEDVRWVAFLVEMDKGAATKRFGAEKAARMTYKHGGSKDDSRTHPWGRAAIWEIWCKEGPSQEAQGENGESVAVSCSRHVYWVADVGGAVLDQQEDPHGLRGFFPCPRPMIDNATTTDYRPYPSYRFDQDLYEAINRVAQRLDALASAVKAVGVYDKGTAALGRLFTAQDNDMIPVENWGLFSERGGVAGGMQMLPLEAITTAITLLQQYADNLIAKLFQVSGMSEIMRGEQTDNGTPGEAGIKARFGSIRMRRKQDEFARFATEAAAIKAELIEKYFDAERIVERSNILATPDAALAQQAVALIKGERGGLCYRVVVRPEAVAMQDFASERNQRAEVLQGISGFMASMQPLMQMDPKVTPRVLEFLRWGVAGLPGAKEIEGVLDEAINEAKADMQAQQQGGQAPPKPDPAVARSQAKVMEIQAKAQADAQKTQAELAADLQRTQAEAAKETAIQEAQTRENLREAVGRKQIEHLWPRPVAPRGFP